MTENEKASLYARISALEERVNQLQSYVNNFATVKSQSALATLQNDRMNRIEQAIQSILTVLDTIRSRLNKR